MFAGTIVVNNSDVWNTRITRNPNIMNGHAGDTAIIYNAYFGTYGYQNNVGQRWLFIG